MTIIDLRKDAAVFRDLLRRCAIRYAAGHRSTVGRPYQPEVSRIDFEYSLGDGTSIPWVYLHLDSKPGSEPDGDPTHPMFDWIEQAEWGVAHSYLVESDGNRMPVILPNGTFTDCDAEGLDQHIGNLLIQSLKDARDQSLLAELPKMARCEMGIESYDSGYGWPQYKARGVENLA